jgi:hypothetical protein
MRSTAPLAHELLCDREIELTRAQLRSFDVRTAPANEPSDDVIKAALCRSYGLADVEKRFKPELLEAADKLGGDYGLQEVILRAAHRNGWSGRERITGGNLGSVLRAAFSTHSLSTLLSDVASKILVDGFAQVEQAWRAISRVRPVKDFKQTTCYRLTADLEYEEVGPGGELKHGTMGQETYWSVQLEFTNDKPLTKRKHRRVHLGERTRDTDDAI